MEKCSIIAMMEGFSMAMHFKRHSDHYDFNPSGSFHVAGTLVNGSLLQVDYMDHRIALYRMAFSRSTS